MTVPDWPVVTITDLGGKITSGSRGWARYYADIGDLFVRITNLRRESIKPDLTNPRYVHINPSEPEASRTRLMEGDLLISITADIGIIGYIDDSFPTPSYINQHIARVRLDPKRVNSKFVSYYLASWEPQRSFVGSTDQGAKAGINLATVAKLTTPLPRRNEQDRIAGVLSDADDLIASLEQLIAKKREVKQGLMQELLTGRTRLPGFVDAWHSRPIGDVAEVVMGQSPRGKSYNTRGIGLPLVQGNADIRYRRTFDRVWTTEPTKRVQKGDVVLTVRAPVGFTAIASRDACLGRGVCGISAGESTAFLFHALIAAEPRWTLLEQGSTFTSVNSAQVRAFEVNWPDDPAERFAISNVLHDADTEISTLERRLVSARSIKLGMMQELLTGRTRLIKEVAS